MIKTINKLFVTIILALAFTASQQKQEVTSPFVSVENGHFVKNGQPYYYVGTNFWYGAILGSEGQGGDRERLVKELDYMKVSDYLDRKNRGAL